MRIFYVTNEYVDDVTLKPHAGGLASYLVKITQALVSRGHDVNVISTRAMSNTTVSWHGVTVRFVAKNGLRRTFLQKLLWHVVPDRTRRRWLDLIAPRTISGILKSENAKARIDIIQYASFGATGLLPERNIPSCVRISSYAKLWQKYYGESDAQEVRNEVEQFRRARFLYGPSRLVAEAIEKDLGLHNKIEIIETPFQPYAGAEDEVRYAELRAAVGDAPYLLFYGTIGLLKGAVEMAGAVREVLTRHPELHLVLVGREMPLPDGSSPVETIRAAACDFSCRVHWFDRQGHDTLFPLIRHAHGVLLPSRVDNLPNTCIEAMGLGKIVIGSRGASFEQLIDDGTSGFLCEAGNAASIPPAVDRLMALDVTSRAAMEAAAFARSRALSLENIVPQVEAYYRRVAAEW